jgi:phosphatidate cytidylyltransferase
MAVLSYLAMKEFFSIVPARRVDRRAIFWAYVTIPFQYFWVAIGWYGMFIIFIPVYAFLFLPARLLLTGPTRGFLHSAGTLHYGLMISVFSLSHMAYLLVLPEDRNPAGGNLGLVLFLLIFTQLNDVAQYLWGTALGKRRIVPDVSPNKTWAGAVGGIATTVVLGGLSAPWLTPLSGWQGYAVSALIGTTGFFGDLTMSAIKRDLGIKDTGSLIPGHGGLLDRIDSLIFTAPLFFHFVYYLKY